jgi:potassium-dependent mechanosensitive channel
VRDGLRRTVCPLRRVGLIVVCLALLALSPTPAGAVWPFSAKGPAPAAPTDQAASASITAPEVARRADEAAKTLRDIDALLVPGPGIGAIQQHLPDIESRLAAQTETTNRQLQDGPSGAALERLTSQWQTLRAEVSTYVNVLAERGTTLERSLTTLTGIRETWTQTRTDVRASKVPAQVVDRIDGILSAVAKARAGLQRERAATLVLQDQVAQHVAQCDEMLARLGTVRTDMAGRVLVRDGVPLWSIGEVSEALKEVPDRVGRAVDSAVADLREFARERQGRIAFALALFAVVATVTYWARRTTAALTLDTGAPTFGVIDRPLAAAWLLTLLLIAFTAPRSRILQLVGEMVVLVPALLVAQARLDPERVRGLYGLGALILVDHVRALVSSVPLLEQLIFLVEALGAISLAAWWLRVHRLRAAAGTRLVPLALTGALVAFAVAAGAAAGGYLRLALFIGSGLAGSMFVALVLYAGVKVTRGLLAVTLSANPLRELRVVQYHRPLLERRLGATLRWLAVVAWGILVLRHFHLWSPASVLVEAALAAELQRGSLNISLGAILIFVSTVVFTFILSAIVRFALQEEIYPRLAPGRALPYAISTLVHYTLVFTGFLLGLAVLGVDLTKVTIVAGALGVGIGFGLQGLVNNFVSGLVILSERRINVGDAVTIGEVEGQVQQLGIRACTVRTWEGAEVIVPNASLVSEKVSNWTLSDRRRRIDVPVGVAYGTAPEKVADILLGVARKHADVLIEPAPLVVMRGFGDSALRFELRVWTNNFDRWFLTQSELAVAGYAALRDAAIEIPLPQREVRVRGA